jgi:hypothetical protein
MAKSRGRRRFRTPSLRCDLVRNLVGNRSRLIVLRYILHQSHRPPLVVLGEQRLRLPADIGADELVGHSKHGFGAAVVLLKPHDFHLGKVGFELQDVLDVGAAPAVNRLIRIAGGRQIRMVD